MVASGVTAQGGEQCGVQLGEGDEVACSGGVDGADDGGVVIKEGAEEGERVKEVEREAVDAAETGDGEEVQMGDDL